jgi:hypothetical protein
MQRKKMERVKIERTLREKKLPMLGFSRIFSSNSCDGLTGDGDKIFQR